jgi:hypothetical protein
MSIPSAPLLVQHDPLELHVKRPTHPGYVLRALHRTPGTPLGKYTLNWIAAGKFSEMLALIFTSDTTEFKQMRKVLRTLGCRFKPQAAAFAVLKVLEKNAPRPVGKEELLSAMQRSIPEATPETVTAAIEYLKDFTVQATGASVLPDFEGGVSLADADTVLTYQNRLTRMTVGIGATQARHGGAALQKRNDVRVVREFPSIQPVLLELVIEEVADASD